MQPDYVKMMKSLLKDEYPLYEEEMKKPALRGYRVNDLKTTPEDLFQVLPFSHVKTPFARNAYYLADQPGAGASPAHAAGLIYLQEPSAASAVTALDPKPGMKILDLCAAPGSKTTQIAEMMNHQGLLVANEIISSRARTLLQNTERWGASNVIVSNNDPSAIAMAFPGCFDAVLVDAPCSGEGMFRKNHDAEKQWSLDLVSACARRQRQILEHAYACLKQGGTLVYSTCTFSKEENEDNLSWFLTQHPDMKTEEIPLTHVHHGIGADMQNAVRIYPMDSGEGHFVCRMRKEGGTRAASIPLLKMQKVPAAAAAFLKENFHGEFPYLTFHEGKVYGSTFPFLSIPACHILRQGILLGEMKKGRFEPSHGLYMNAWTAPVKRIEVNDEEAAAYLKGLSIRKQSERGYAAVCWHGYPIGFAKSDGIVLKNHYPKELRNR